MAQSKQVVREAARETPLIGEADLLVVGGGAAGTTAAIAAAGNGARVILTERYPHLGGWRAAARSWSLTTWPTRPTRLSPGISDEIVDRLDEMGGAVYPPEGDQFTVSEGSWARWGR